MAKAKRKSVWVRINEVALKYPQDADKATGDLVPTLSNDDIWEVCKSLVENAQRALVRHDEHKIQVTKSASTPKVGQLGGPPAKCKISTKSMAAALGVFHRAWDRDFLKQQFSLGDGTKVPWGAATREQHEQRILFFEKQIAGNRKTQQLHQDAIADINSRPGAKCLNDVVPAIPKPRGKGSSASAPPPA